MMRQLSLKKLACGKLCTSGVVIGVILRTTSKAINGQFVCVTSVSFCEFSKEHNNTIRGKICDQKDHKERSNNTHAHVS